MALLVTAVDDQLGVVIKHAAGYPAEVLEGVKMRPEEAQQVRPRVGEVLRDTVIATAILDRAY